MSEPTTQAGRALMARWYADWTGTGELRDLVVAIEAEARAPLIEALERTLRNSRLLLAAKPVRDATETIAEAEAALAATAQEER